MGVDDYPFLTPPRNSLILAHIADHIDSTTKLLELLRQSAQLTHVHIPMCGIGVSCKSFHQMTVFCVKMSLSKISVTIQYT